jgi:ABC-type nitrate/sulfonate/bicarbonate transport system permease component
VSYSIEQSRRAGRGGGRVGHVLLRVVPPAVVLVVISLLWNWYVESKHSFYLADAGAIFSAFIDELSDGAVWSALWTSDISLLVGFAIAVAIGVPIGLIIGRVKRVDRLLAPYLQIALVTPIAVLMPIVLVALGLSRTAQIVVVVLFALPFVVVPTRGGVVTIPRDWLDMASSYGARELQVWRLVLVPGALHAIVNGLRLGFAHALTGEITVELSLIAIGIGQLIIRYQSHYQAAALFAFVLLISVQSIVAMGLLSLIQRKVRRS